MKILCLRVTNISSIKNTWKETAHYSGAEGRLLSCLLTSGCVISTLYTDVLRLSDTRLLLVKADQLQASSSRKPSCQVSMVQLLCSGSASSQLWARSRDWPFVGRVSLWMRVPSELQV